MSIGKIGQNFGTTLAKKKFISENTPKQTHKNLLT
jgi:hypothetical protein